MVRPLAALALLSLSACIGPIEEASDAGLPDAGVQLDGGAQPDAGPRDAGTADSGAPDAGPIDAGAADAGPLDAGVPDAGPADAGLLDAGPPDSGLPAAVGPLCSFPGTRSEGWYREDGGRICWTTCSGLISACQAAGTRSEGWYARGGDGGYGGCSSGATLIEYASCAP